MSYSQAQICTIALGNIGINKIIEDLDADESSDGHACQTHYAAALETTLKAWRWPFAQRSVALATISSYDGDQWYYAYRAPSDYLLAHAVNPLQEDPVGQPYQIGGDDSGLIIYTDAPDAILAYTALISQPGLYSADFVDAIAWQLAIRIAMPLAAAEGYRQAARQGYIAAIAAANTNTGNESRPAIDPDGAFVTARGLNRRGLDA